MLLKILKFKVVRKTDIGYILERERVEYFIHRQEILRELKENEIIEAFLYIDKYKRIAATMKYNPNLKIINDKSTGFFKVSNIANYGVFLNINAAKDILLSSKYLPNQKKFWPHRDDLLLIRLDYKEDKMFASFLNLDELNLGTYQINDQVKATVYRINEKNAVLVDENYNKFLLDFKFLLDKKIRVGEILDLTVLSNGQNYTLVKLKEEKMESLNHEKEYVYNLLQKNYPKGYKYTSLTSPEVIFKDFKISKKAFKRAIGMLYKERKLEILPDRINLI